MLRSLPFKQQSCWCHDPKSVPLKVNELGHSKTYKMTCALSDDSDQHTHFPDWWEKTDQTAWKIRLIWVFAVSRETDSVVDDKG